MNIRYGSLDILAETFGVTKKYLISGDEGACYSQLALCELITSAGYSIKSVCGGYDIVGHGREFRLSMEDYNLISEQVQILVSHLLETVSMPRHKILGGDVQ